MVEEVIMCSNVKGTRVNQMHEEDAVIQKSFTCALDAKEQQQQQHQQQQRPLNTFYLLAIGA